ncbi:MAG: P-type conjugative transfer protein TrbG [Hyphomicrobiaceae bacterium]
MTARPLPLGLALFLTACTQRVEVPEIKFDVLSDKPPAAAISSGAGPSAPVQIVEVPRPLPLPGQLKPLPKRDVVTPDTTSAADKIGAAHTAAKLEPTRAGFINAIQLYPYTKGALYQLYAAVNQVTDVALEAGEKLTSVSAGDTVRWVVGDTTSGEGKDSQVHILVKPIAPDITTNLVIATDRRTYHIELHATEKTYMASVSWTYPAASLVALKGQADVPVVTSVEPGPKAEDIRFRYRLDGDAPWKPTRVFDDSAKVYIQFPSGLKQGEVPPLFIIDGSGKPALVNYRVKGSTYIVDRLFAAAELRLGTAPQQVVRIIRTDAVWKERQD